MVENLYKPKGLVWTEGISQVGKSKLFVDVLMQRPGEFMPVQDLHDFVEERAGVYLAPITHSDIAVARKLLAKTSGNIYTLSCRNSCAYFPEELPNGESVFIHRYPAFTQRSAHKEDSPEALADCMLNYGKVVSKTQVQPNLSPLEGAFFIQLFEHYGTDLSLEELESGAEEILQNEWVLDGQVWGADDNLIRIYIIYLNRKLKEYNGLHNTSFRVVNKRGSGLYALVDSIPA